MNFPEWLNLEVWEAFVEMRRKDKHPLTEYGKKLILRDLESFMNQGYDPTLCLEESIKRNWRGVFPQGERVQRDKHGQQFWITPEGFRSYYKQ